DCNGSDRAMVCGFNWKVGPFQLWDLMGFERVKKRIEKEIGPLPEWVANRSEPFYKEGEILENLTPMSEKVDANIWETEASTLSVINDNQVLFNLHTANKKITGEITDELKKKV